MRTNTDPKRVHPTDPGDPKGNPVFIYHEIFNPNKKEVEEFKERYRKGNIGDVEIKERLFEVLNAFLKPIRERRIEFSKKEDELGKILEDGTRRTREIAKETMKKVKKAMKIDY